MIEASSILNLLTIFVFSIYTTSNTVVVYGSVSLAMLHLLYIILLHVMGLLRNTALKNTHFSWNLISERFNKIRHKTNKDQSNTLKLINPVPEVAYNYEEFREPLIGQDK